MRSLEQPLGRVIIGRYSDSFYPLLTDDWSAFRFVCALRDVVGTCIYAGCTFRVFSVQNEQTLLSVTTRIRTCQTYAPTIFLYGIKGSM